VHTLKLAKFRNAYFQISVMLYSFVFRYRYFAEFKSKLPEIKALTIADNSRNSSAPRRNNAVASNSRFAD